MLDRVRIQRGEKGINEEGEYGVIFISNGVTFW
jgi:hypothetical protein